MFKKLYDRMLLWSAHEKAPSYLAVLSAADLLSRNADPSEHEVREWLEGNLCRCTGYHGIVKAVMAASNGGA